MFFIDPPTTYMYTLSLHDALPICANDLLLSASVARADHRAARHAEFSERRDRSRAGVDVRAESCIHAEDASASVRRAGRDRKSTRLNSSHTVISYAVFCLKKKNTT